LQTSFIILPSSFSCLYGYLTYIGINDFSDVTGIGKGQYVGRGGVEGKCRGKDGEGVKEANTVNIM
jgi:hypothetical protein